MISACRNITLYGKSVSLYDDNFMFTGQSASEVIFVGTGNVYDAKFIGKYPNLKVIASNTTGDSHIDTAYCKEHGIEVITLKNDDIRYELTAVAELTVGLIIALTRNLIPAINSVERGEWDRYPYGGKKMLSDMSIGIVGRGRIGCMVNNVSYDFFKDVLLYDNSDEYKQCREIWGKPSYCNLEEVLRQDIVTVHIPVDGNEGLFDEKMFSKIKDGAYFINTSRGEIVDELALVRALESGKLAGAATDVISGEFEPGFNVKNSPLWHYAQAHDNLLICPHIGGSTEDSWEKTQIRIIEKVLEFLG